MRIVLDIILLISVLFWPWYVTGILALIGIIFFERYYEALAAAIGMDVLYHLPEKTFFASWLNTFVMLIVYIVVRFVHGRIRT